MQYETFSINTDAGILKRSPFEAIPLTLDFSEVETTDDAGNKVVKAGSPIGSSGTVDNTATAIGILLFDVIEQRPQGTILKKAYIDEAKAAANSGVTIASAVKSALPMIVFE